MNDRSNAAENRNSDGYSDISMASPMKEIEAEENTSEEEPLS